MSVSTNQTVITNAGLGAAVTAGNNGATIEITTFQLGSALITPSATMTGVTGFVYEGTSSQITYSANASTSTMTFFVTLSESVGTFYTGNIGLFLSDGTMFTITALANLDYKTVTNTSVTPNIVGNVRIYAIPIALTNVQNLINVTALFANYASLPSVATEAQLPSVSTAPYNAYLVNSYSSTDTSSIALTNGSDWVQVLGVVNTSDSAIIIPNLFNYGFAEGTVIAWSGSTLVAWDPSVTTSTYVGIVGQNNLVYTSGVFTISSGSPYTVGTAYYSGTGSSAGILTSTPPIASNAFLVVGNAITTDSLILNAQCSEQLYLLDEDVLSQKSLFNNINSVTTPYTCKASDFNSVIQASSGVVYLPPSSLLYPGFQLLIQSTGPTGVPVTINPNGNTVSLFSGNTTSSFQLPNANGVIGDFIWLEWNGSYLKVNGGSPALLGAVYSPRPVYTEYQAGSITTGGSSTQYTLCSVSITFPTFSKSGSFRLNTRMVAQGQGASDGTQDHTFQNILYDGTNYINGVVATVRSDGNDPTWGVTDTITTTNVYTPGSTVTFSYIVYAIPKGSTGFTISGSYIWIFVEEA